MIVRKMIDEGRQPTPEQMEELEALEAMSDEDIVYDEDCPKLTDEQLQQMKRVSSRIAHTA